MIAGLIENWTILSDDAVTSQAVRRHYDYILTFGATARGVDWGRDVVIRYRKYCLCLDWRKVTSNIAGCWLRLWRAS